MSQTRENYIQPKTNPDVGEKSTIAIISAAGIGYRIANQDSTIPPLNHDNVRIIPKQYIELSSGINSLFLALRAFIIHEDIDMVCAIVHHKHLGLYNHTLAQIIKYNKTLARKILPPIVLTQSESRYESVKAGVEFITSRYDYDNILIHDAARPFIESNIISSVVSKLNDYMGVNVIYPIVDTLRCYDAITTHDRDHFYLSQTPQGFDAKVIAQMYQKQDRGKFSDDIGLLAAAGARISTVQGDSLNFKITYTNDLLIARALLLHLYPDLCKLMLDIPKQEIESRAKNSELPKQDNDAEFQYCRPRYKVGIGFDMHAFREPDCRNNSETNPETKPQSNGLDCQIILGGIAIPHTKQIDAHSDGDVLLHAVTDAILGASGNGSIGEIFPPSDPKWKDAPSTIFVSHAIQLLQLAGGRVINLDATIIAQNPRIMPYADQIKEKLASLLAIEYQDVNIKAVTTEKLGSIGREEGIAAQVICMVEL